VTGRAAGAIGRGNSQTNTSTTTGTSYVATDGCLRGGIRDEHCHDASPLSLSSKAATSPTDVQFVENLSIFGTADRMKHTHALWLLKDERIVSLSMEELVLLNCAKGDSNSSTRSPLR
jgi:hypothetical protein